MIDEVLKDKLLAQYKEYGKLIIAFDYDDTVFPFYVHKSVVQPNIDVLVRAQEQGHTLILYTCRVPGVLVHNYLKAVGITTQWFNSSPVYTAEGSKLFFNVLLDDKCGIDYVRRTISAVLDVIEQDSV